MVNHSGKEVKRDKYGNRFIMRKALGCLFQRGIVEYERLKDYERPTPHYISFTDKKSLTEDIEKLDSGLFAPEININS
jgi:hypothetical protein